MSRRPPAHHSGQPAADLIALAKGLLPRSDAEFLLMALLGVPRHQLYLDAAVAAPVAHRFRRLAARAADGWPVQYLVRSAPFLDFDLFVDRRVLIPRPETEELASRVIDRLRANSTLKRRAVFLDFGTGSGCLAIALARAFPDARIVAVDASPRALTVARRNVSRHGLGRRIRLVVAHDLANPALQRCRGRLALIISNPPYIPTDRINRLDPRVRDFEPRVALDGGPDGANIVAMLLRTGPGLLAEGGLLAIEIDWSHRRLVRRLCPSATLERDASGRTRFAFHTAAGRQ